MGTADLWTYPADGEGPVHEVTLAPFRIDATAVTNARFADFVAATGYRTDAEQFGWAFVFAGLLPDEFEPTRGVAAAPWWRQVYGADWAHPEGPDSNVGERGDHPVVQVSWRDADGVLRVGRDAAADRGGMGVRGARRDRRRGVPVGQRPRARRRPPHERVAGHVSGREHARRRISRHRAGRRRSRPTASASTT